MTHPTQDELYRYLDGTLDDASAHDVREHLEACPACAGELHFQQRLSESITSIPPEQVRPGFTAAVMEAVAPAAERLQAKSAYPSFGLAAIVLLIIVTLVVVIATGETPTTSSDGNFFAPWLQIASDNVSPVTEFFRGITSGVTDTISESGRGGMARVLGIAFLAILFFAILDKLLIRRVQNPGT